MAQIRNPLREGGMGLTANAMVIHSSFFAGFSTSLSWLARSSLRQYLTHDPLGVTTGSASHAFLKGFMQCREELIRCGCFSSDSMGPIPDKAVVLPSLAEIYPDESTADLPHLPAQRVLTGNVREHHELWQSSLATAGGTAYDSERVSHLSRTKIKANGGTLPTPGGDKTELAQNPLSWILTVPGSPVYDTFPRSLFIIYISLVLGVPQPKDDHAPTLCHCQYSLDTYGHHRLTCQSWYRNTAIKGHDAVLEGIIDAARSIGVGSTTHSRQVPTHHHSKKKGDVIFDIKLKSDMRIIGDLSICHPVSGRPSGVTPLGTWMGTTMQSRFSAKSKKHRAAYEAQLLHFVPLIVSTFGVLHEDFLRLLWILTSESRGSGLAVGEVREAGPGAGHRQMLFAKMRARVAVLVAKSAAMRFAGYSVVPSRIQSCHSHIPTDLMFSQLNPPLGNAIGPVREV
jgi:hypothetical protein